MRPSDNRSFTLSALITGILLGSTSQMAQADVESGKAWLADANNGNSRIANNLQTKQEVALTLSTLQSSLPANDIDFTTALETESSSEGLVRLILLAHQQGDTLHPAWQQLINNQNTDGGFAHVQGWQSNPLDTAFVLIALDETGYLDNLDPATQQQWQTRIAKALTYLSNQQQTDGSYQISHLDELYTSSYVLSAFTPYLGRYGQYIANAQTLVTYLESKQTDAGIWSTQPMQKGLFLDALVADSLYPYQSSTDSATFSSAFSERVLALQSADGSWQQDGYVTALVLRALDTLSKPVANPITSAISLSVIDTETGLNLAGVTLSSTADSAEQVTATSTSDGQLLLKDVQEGDYTFTLSKDGYATVQFQLTLRQGEQVNVGQIALSRAEAVSNGQIQGTVTDKQLGTAISDATVTVVLVDEAGKRLANFEPIVTTTNSEGKYQIVLTEAQQQASAGRFGIDVRSPDYAPVQGSGTVRAGGVVLFSPTLTNVSALNASLIGTVVDETGQPLDGADIKNADTVLTSTDITGGFTLSPLNLGMQTLQISKAGYYSATLSLNVTRDGAIDAGQITLQKVQLSDPSDPTSEPLPPEVVNKVGNIEITATDALLGKPITGFSVTAEQLNEAGNVIQTQSIASENNNEQQSNASQLTLGNLPVGTWRITVSHPAYQSAMSTIDLQADQTAKVTPALDLNPYALSGTVVDSQTNQPIESAPIAVYNDDTDERIYTGTTGSDGNFTLPSNLTVTNLRIDITPKDYLPTTRYVSREFETSTNVDMGEIRLRPKSAQVILPDLKVTELDTSGLATEQQSLLMQGGLVARVSNEGNADVSATTPVQLTAFIDANDNRQLDDDEQIMGQATLSSGLAQSEQTDINIDISGKVDFRDAPIAVMIDSTAQVAEKDEENNVRLTSDGVEIKPEQGTLEAEEVWMYGYKASDPDKPSNWSSYGSSASAVAAPLYDTNDDGKIGEGDVASIIYNNYFNKMTVLDGRNGEVQWTASVNSRYTSPAIGDVDNDGFPEVIVNNNNYVEVYSNAGQLKKRWQVYNRSDFSMNDLILADLNNDSSPEIIVGDSISNFKDGLVHRTGTGSILAIANLNESPEIELVTRNGIYTYNYQEQSSVPLAQYSAKRYASIADVTNDGKSNVVTSGDGYFTIYDGLGNQISRYRIPQGGSGGVPTLADFDGDGIADMGIAGASAYTVMRSDGSIIWSVKTQDRSSNVTGSSIFDFNNDGQFEVVYADEDYFRIYDAQTGDELYKTPNSSHTAHEAPIVLDADADGHADVLFVSNNSTGRAGKTAGIRMISSKNKDWANTRNIWNQYSYHVTNINDDLSVPQNEPNSWEVHNTYRANLLLNQNSTAASDLTASYLQITDNGTSSPSTFTARIGNAGGKPVKAGTPISFYRRAEGQDDMGATLIGTATLSQILAGGDYEDISLDYNPLLQNGQNGLADFGELIVIANDAGAGVDSATGVLAGTDKNTPVVQEYTRGNNVARIAITGGFNALTLAGEIDKTHYTASETVTITSIPTNLGSFPTQPDVRVSIIDSAGNVIEQFADTPVDLGVSLLDGSLPNINSTTVTTTWNTAQNRTGNYTARIELILQDDVVASVDRPFAIVADGMINAPTDSQIYTDKTTYLATDLVELNSRLINTTSNAMATQRDVNIEVKDPDGQVIWSQTYGYDELAPNAIRDQFFTLPLTTADAGDYTVTQTTVATDGSQSEQIRTATFKVLSAAESGMGVSGTIDSPAQVQVGEQIDWQWSVTNDSTVDLDNMPLSIALYKGNEEQPFSTIALDAVSLNVDGTVSGMLPWNSSNHNLADGDVVTAVLIAEFSGVSKGLASSQVTLIQPPVEVSFDNPVNEATLLVYYSCNDGWNNLGKNQRRNDYSAACYDDAEMTLTSYLDRIDIDYKLVRSPEDFYQNMQSGVFEQYWLLGTLEKLDAQAQAELTELVYSGDNLLMDGGMHSWQNRSLYSLAGVTYRGQLKLDNGDIITLPAYFSTPDDRLIASTALSTITDLRGRGNWALNLVPTKPTMQTWANHTGGYSDRIAMAADQYGMGVPIATSFDLVGSLSLAMQDNTSHQPSVTPSWSLPTDADVSASEYRWDWTLNDILQPRSLATIKQPIDYAPYDVVKIPLTLTNTGNTPRTIQVDISLPDGSTWLGYESGADGVYSTASEQHYQITLKPQQTLTDVLTIRLASQTGTQAVAVSVNDVSGGANTLLERFEARYLVRSLEHRLTLIGNELNTWQASKQNKQRLRQAQQSMTLLEQTVASQDYEQALYYATNLATQCDAIDSVSTATREQLRLEIDELIRALQVSHYQTNINDTNP